MKSAASIQMVEVACGMPSLMMGDSLNDVATRHRLQNHPPAHRRLRRHHAVQFPVDGAALDVPVRHRLRQHVRPEAFGESPSDADAHRRTLARCGIAGRSPQPDSRRQSRSRCAAASSTGEGGLIRRLDAGREVHLHHRRRRRQARAGARRREESPRRHGRCRYAQDGRSDHRLGVRRRGRALPRRQRAGPGGRCRRSLARPVSQAHRTPSPWAMARRTASKWARW